LFGLFLFLLFVVLVFRDEEAVFHTLVVTLGFIQTLAVGSITLQRRG
jgi:hypothetical protein